MRDNDANELEKALEISEGEAILEVVMYGALKEQLERILEGLSEREEGIIKMRFGLEDGEVKTLDEIAKRYNVSRERIRQIESKVMRKLRHPSRSQTIIDYLDD